MTVDWKTFLGPKVRIVQEEPGGVYVLYKPCNIMSMPNHPGVCQNALFRLPYDPNLRCYTISKREKIFLLNRLDSPTSGILLVCFCENLAKQIRQIFRLGKVYKEYRALVKNHSLPPSGIWEDYLEKIHEQNYVRACCPKTSKGTLAKTKYTIIDRKSIDSIPLAVLQLEPITGRTHQLRIQCASRNIPIIGDKTYGDFTLNRQLQPRFLEKKLYLQSCAISLQYFSEEQKCCLISRIPYEF